MEETSYSSASRTPLNHQRCIRLSFRGNIILGVGKEFSFKMPIADSQLHQNVETLNSYILGHSSKLNEHIQLPRPLDNGSKADSEAWRNSSRDAFLKPNGDLIPTVSNVAEGLSINDGKRTHLADHCGATPAGSRDQFYAHNEFFQTDGKDLVANDHELRSISSEIPILKNTISRLESKLLLVSLKKELLGKDYAGRLFWAFYRPGSTPWILVDCSMLAQEDSTSSGHTGVGCSSSASSSSQSDAEENHHFKVGAREPKPKWFSCQSEAEVSELIRWLRCFEPMDNDFIVSSSCIIALSQRPKIKAWQKCRGLKGSSCLKSGNPPSLTRDTSLRPVTGREVQFLRQLEICLLDIDASPV